jgi:hypothetical protein
MMYDINKLAKKKIPEGQKAPLFPNKNPFRSSLSAPHIPMGEQERYKLGGELSDASP